MRNYTSGRVKKQKSKTKPHFIYVIKNTKIKESI